MDSCGYKSAVICDFAAQFPGYTSAENPVLFLFNFSLAVALGYFAAIFPRQLLAPYAVAADSAGMNVTRQFSEMFIAWGEVEDLSLSQRTKRESSLLVSLANGKKIRVVNVQSEDVRDLVKWWREKELIPPAPSATPRAT